MPQFATSEELAAKLGGLFQDAVTDEALFRRLQKLGGIVRLQLKDPAGQITVKAKADEPGVVDVGPSKLNPDVIVRLDGDTAHGWFSGELNPTIALSKGQMRATGAVDMILRLVPLAPALTEQYQAVLEHGGRLTEPPATPEPEAEAEVAAEGAEAAASEAPAEGAEAPAETSEAAAEAEAPEVTTEAPEGGEPAATEEPVAAEVVEQAPEAPAPAAEEEPAVAEAPAGEPEVVDAIGAQETEEAAASEAPAEESAASEAPAEESAVSEAPAEEPAAPEAPAEESAASEAPAEEASQPDPAPEDEAPPQS